MMDMLWLILLVALKGSHLGCALPVGAAPQTYPQGPAAEESWYLEGRYYAVAPTLALALTAAMLLFGCTWCYRHKSCKLFSASATHLHDGSRRSHPPDSGFSEPINNNVGEANNNGPISLREMQNIANNNAAAYIISENEEHNRAASRESVVEFEPLPAAPGAGLDCYEPIKNIGKVNNNGPISLREMQNIANNNAAAYIISENEERNRAASRESVVEFEPLPAAPGAGLDCYGYEDFPRSRLQYLREIDRGWFGRIVEGEIEVADDTPNRTVAVKILNQNATPEQKTQFLNEARVYRELQHDHLLGFVTRSLQEEPWILVFDLCPVALQQYLVENWSKMAMLNESGVPLRLECDITSALAYLHSHGLLYGNLWSGNVLVRGAAESARGVLGRYKEEPAPHDAAAPELRHRNVSTISSEVWSVGVLLWEVCSWGALPPSSAPLPEPALPCPYRSHLYQVMQLCWNENPEARPTTNQVHALLNHLYTSHQQSEVCQDDGYGSSDFEERWQRLKPNSIPKIDEHIAIVHAPSTSNASHFTGSDIEYDNSHTVQDSLSIDMDTAVSRSSSIMSDKELLSVPMKSASLNNLHGSLDDVRAIYLTHNENAALECHQANIIEDKEHDRSDSSVDPWLKEIIATNQDDDSYYKDVSDVMKNLDNILNSEKTSSSESSHEASPSRDNLSLDCKQEYQAQSSLVKSPGIRNFQNVLDLGFGDPNEQFLDDEADRETIGTLSHSYERHSDTNSQNTLENVTPITPNKDLNIFGDLESQIECTTSLKDVIEDLPGNDESIEDHLPTVVVEDKYSVKDNRNEQVEDVYDLPLKEQSSVENDSIRTKIPKLKQLCLSSMPSVNGQQCEIVHEKKDCLSSCDISKETVQTDTNNISVSTKSIEVLSVHNEKIKIPDSGFKEYLNTDSSQHLDNIKVPPEVISIKKGFISQSHQAPQQLLNDLTKIKSSPVDDDSRNVNSIDDVYCEKVVIFKDKTNGKITEKNDESIEHDKDLSINKFVIHCDSDPDKPHDETYSLASSSSLKHHTENLSSITESSTNLHDNLFSKHTDFVKDEIPSSNSQLEPQLQNEIMMTESNDKINEMKDATHPLEVGGSEVSQIQDVSHTNQIYTFQEGPNHTGAISENINLIKKFLDEERLTAFDQINKLLLKNSKINNILQEYTLDENFADKEPITLKQAQILTLDKQDLKQKQDNEVPIEVKVENISKNASSEPGLSQDLEPELVQKNETIPLVINITDVTIAGSVDKQSLDTLSILPIDNIPDIVQNIEYAVEPESFNQTETQIALENNDDLNNILPRSEDTLGSNESTAYMDLTNDTKSEVTKKDNTLDNYDMLITGVDTSNFSNEKDCTVMQNESTVYLDIPQIIHETRNFLDNERNEICLDENNEVFNDVNRASTPRGSDNDESLYNSVNLDLKPKHDDTPEVKPPNYGPGVKLTKLEQKYVPDNISPFDSPTKSHPTDTYDENSSVVLGPFENCTLDLYKGVKSSSNIIDMEEPREEVLAFSSNFSEINLETPSPLNDGNFLKEVPDIELNDDQFDDIESTSAPRSLVNSEYSDSTEKQSEARQRAPSTPPNSPGNFLATTSQQKYLVDIDLNQPGTSRSSLASTSQQEIELNQIELQITSKLAMAENENNFNIEYSGPLTVEGIETTENPLWRGDDDLPESILAGNCGSIAENSREDFALDESCMQALRTELELKLPLAQVVSIEPSAEEVVEEFRAPEILVNYPGALSPIAEETGNQLSAYENDLQWNSSNRTDSSESYLEPCNNSTDEVTELATAGADQSGAADQFDGDTYSVHSDDEGNHTYTVPKDATTSREITMSADSLNGSPYKKPKIDILSPIDDHTYNKPDDEKESNCERLSQVSPFILSPTTESSVPGNSENVTAVSTLSKTTIPSDAHSSKPSEPQCLSKAPSIDSWCSNDTLFNVEEDFDDLAMDADVPIDYETEKEDHSDSSHTLTHNDDDKDMSHCSTYIVHDSKSEPCDTFSPDSITANKVKTETENRTPIVMTNSEIVDSSPKDTQTKDLAYGTMASGQCSYSNCTTELLTGNDEAWIMARPELMRRSPIGDDSLNVTPPKLIQNIDRSKNLSPTLKFTPTVQKMDSVDITCFTNVSGDDNEDNLESQNVPATEHNDSPDYRSMAQLLQSTPCTETEENDDVQPIPLQLPDTSLQQAPNFLSFLNSAELRPQDISLGKSQDKICTNEESETNAVNESKVLSNDELRSPSFEPSVPNFQGFLRSAELRPQDIALGSGQVIGNLNQELTSLNNESRTISWNHPSSIENAMIFDPAPSYSDFADSVVNRSQEVRSNSSQSVASAVSPNEEFRIFESSLRNRPQDLSTAENAHSILLKSEKSSDLMASSGYIGLDQTSQNSTTRLNNFTSHIIAENSIINPVIDVLEAQVSNADVVRIPETDFDEHEQPHSIIITTESPKTPSNELFNSTYDSHTESKMEKINNSYDSHELKVERHDSEIISLNEESKVVLNEIDEKPDEIKGSIGIKSDLPNCQSVTNQVVEDCTTQGSPNSSIEVPIASKLVNQSQSSQFNGNNEHFATVNFINENFEELIESNVDGNDSFKDSIHELGDGPLSSQVEQNVNQNEKSNSLTKESTKAKSNIVNEIQSQVHIAQNEDQSSPKADNSKRTSIETTSGQEDHERKTTSVSENFLENEKKFCRHDSYLPLLNDIRFSGPASEIMSTSFSVESPTEASPPEDERARGPAADILKDWDSDSDDSQAASSSSGEFIWKDGDGHETSVVTSTQFQHQRGSRAATHSGPSRAGEAPHTVGSVGSVGSGESGSSGSGSEGDEVEFVPSSWNCRAEPSKSSLRSLEQQQTADSKKRVVFKRQKYHCVYEYPREVADVECDPLSPAVLPDYSTYAEWDAASAEEAELGYGQLFGGHPLDLYQYQRAGVSFGADYDQDFFISSSARPFESYGIMSTTSQFFPGMAHAGLKAAALAEPRDSFADDVSEDFPPPPSPLPSTIATRTPSLDFTTPDSGVEDITPGSTSTEDDYKKKLIETECWRPMDSGSSSESVSPSSPGGEALGGLRHTRDKLKLDLPPSPHIPSPRHNRVFNFVLDKPKSRRPIPDEAPAESGSTPLVMTDGTPVVTSAIVPLDDGPNLDTPPEPTFSTFGKTVQRNADSEPAIILDEVKCESGEAKDDEQKAKEPKGGTAVDSGDEDSGIESSAKASLERNKTPNVSLN